VRFLENGEREFLLAVAADGLDRATFHGFFAEAFLLGGNRLLVNVAVAAVIVAREVCGRSFAAKIAIDALIVDVEGPCDVLRVFVSEVSHRFGFF